MRKIFPLIPLALGILACGFFPRSTPDVAGMVNATLTAIAQETPALSIAAETGTTPSPTSMMPPEEDQPVLSVEVLRSAVYSSPDWGEFQLTDGIYYRTPLTPQESPEIYTTRLLDTFLYGDLNADGSEDAVVFLSTQNGGTGHFIEMAAVLNLEGSPSSLTAVSLGDRIVVESGAIQNGVITLNLRVHGLDDGLCCPSQQETRSYRLVGEALVKMP